MCYECYSNFDERCVEELTPIPSFQIECQQAANSCTVNFTLNSSRASIYIYFLLYFKLIMSTVPILDFSVIARGCQVNCTEEMKTTSYGMFSIKCCSSDFCNLSSNSTTNSTLENKSRTMFINKGTICFQYFFYLLAMFMPEIINIYSY